MPELPEVEVARRVIESVLGGARIARVHVRDAAVAAGLEAIVGMEVVGVGRRGKWLRIELSRDALVFAHLGMTGKWVAIDAGAEPLRHERARLEVARAKSAKRATNDALAYVDTRRWGRIRVAHEDAKAWGALGPDALTDGVDPRALYAALHGKRRTIKEALLDQRILAGVGNIHAIEALWRARIDPRSRTDALTLADVRAIASGIRASLAFALRRYERNARVDYVSDPDGANPYRIYDRGGEPCPRCKTALTRIVLGARTTTFCSRCQRRVRVRGS